MRTLRVGSALAFVVLGLLLGAPVGQAQSSEHNPILFVHGIEGSGAQFESQKMRFISNGYPADWFDEVDYNSTRAVGDKSEVNQQIDEAIANLKQRTGKSQVDVVAHSLGTTVMNAYLTDSTLGAQRRANVGHYINVDGQSNNPGVPTLAVWAGRGTPGRNMAGAENVTVPNQTHVQVCTSAESFAEYYEFLTGEPPAYTEIVRENGPIQIAGKALNFPENSGAVGATVEIWPVNDLGRRIGSSPLHSLTITDASTGGGAWGPVTVESGQRYEFALVTAGLPTLHIYREPFPRSDYTVRLLQSLAIEETVGNRPGSTAGVHIRYKELWGDQGSESDELLVNGLNICTPTLCPISKQVNAFFIYDVNRDGQTDLSEPDPTLSALPFITGADVFVRGFSPPDDTIAFQLTSRGSGPARTLDIPNWEAVLDGWSIQWNDFERTIAPDAYARPKGATPLRVPLVPAYKQCSAPNRTHGAPLAFGSCAPPELASDFLTVGTPDANGQASNSSGFVGLSVVTGDASTASDEADVLVGVRLSDVRNAGSLTDYTGALRENTIVRITDRYNGSGSGDPNEGATMVDIPFPVDVGCTPTASATIGSACAIDTSLDAIVPGSIREGDRAVWELGAIEVWDGGSDGDPVTAGDDTLFARQGLFTP